MKKIIPLLLCAVMVFCLFGCQKQEPLESPISFYYQSLDDSYEANSTAIQSESREGKDLADLQEIFDIYLLGPDSADLVSPFPDSLRLISHALYGNTMYLTFSDELGTLSGLELTIACCCITLTCLELTEATSVCISAENALLGGKKSITLSREDIMLLDLVQQPRKD